MKKLAIDPSEFINKVLIQQRTITRNTEGGVVCNSHATIGEAYCAIKPFMGRKYDAANKTICELTNTIIMRYRTDLTAHMRLVDKVSGVVYEIVSFYNDGKKDRYLICDCKQSDALS